jgi:hypothetical protein
MNQDLVKINRITPVLAQEFISCDEDQLNTPAHYFTLTPLEDGWEKVTYYTNRRSSVSIPTAFANCQWVYILSNPSIPGLVKIGFTKNRPSKRVKEINAATGVAMDFVVEWAFPCFNAHDLEKEVHAYLQSEGFRTNNRKEFFNITLEQAKAVIERIGEPYTMKE